MGCEESMGCADLIADGQRRPGSRGGRGPLFLLILLACGIVSALVFVVTMTSRPPLEGAGANYQEMADQLDFFQTGSDFSGGKMDRVVLNADVPASLGLADPGARFPRMGTWTSPEMPGVRPFSELLPSYNAHCPPETGLRFDVRTRDAQSGNWSPWFFLGDWGRTIGNQDRIIRNDFGHVEIDILYLERPGNAYQVRVRFFAFSLDEKTNPLLRRLAVCTSGVEKNESARAASMRPIATKSIDSRDLPVPFRAQGLAAKPLRPEICSPTSVSMVMQYLGRDRPTEENALAIYDGNYAMFGNWGRAVAWAGENGFDAWLTRFRSWEQVNATIAQGQPIIASIRFKKGQCPSFVLKQTDGHLIVIRGFTSGGDLIVNDPASKERGNGAIYKADELAKAWLAHGGVGYIIRKPLP